MRWNMHKRFWNGFASALSIAMATVFMAGCSDDVAGGASGDAGVYAIKNLDVAGLTQKGPFVKGSAVTVLGINCKSMKLSDEHFEGEVKSEKGDFTVDDVSLKSSCAVLEATGKYRSEITGKMSSGEITLHALTDLKDRKNVNVNVITELEYERVMYLVTEKKMNFADAKKQAEKEVLAAFGIAGNFDSSEDLNIFGKGDGNAALLAVSVLLQAETDVAGIEKRLEKFADSFAETGKWNDSSAKTAIEKWRVAAMADGTLDSIRKNVESWGYADEAPDFEKYIETFGDSVTLGSEYDATANTLKDLRDGQTYRTVKIGDQVWMAENLNFETASSSCYNDSAEYCEKYGRLYTWATAVGKSEDECGVGKECNLPSGNIRGVCPDGWYLPSEDDFVALIKAVGGEKGAGSKLKSTSGWHDDEGESGNGTDAFGFSALPAGISNAGYYGVGYTTGFWGSTECGTEGVPETGNGCAYAMYFDYDDVYVCFRGYAAKDFGYSVRCVKRDDGTVPASSSSSAKADAGSEYDASANTLKDLRDGQTYRTVKIGDQVWMAENLNYEVENSFCNEDSIENCNKYGRLYTIAAAVDSAGTFSSTGKDCGYFTRCSLEGTVRGVCPSGWHLPDGDEWKTLFVAVGAKPADMRPSARFKVADLLMSQSGWSGDMKGTDDFGFTVLPGGYRIGGIDMNFNPPKIEPHYYGAGNMAGFLYVYERPNDSTFYGFTYNYSWILAYIEFFANNNEVKVDTRNKDDAYSVRCVMDGSLVMLSSSSSVPSSSSEASSSSETSSSSHEPVALAQACKTETEDNCEYGVLTDERDGKSYKTVKIGSQWWMAENLNYYDSTDVNVKRKSWCYGADFNKDSSTCDVYGRLYRWAAAIDSLKWAKLANGRLDCGYMMDCTLPSKVQGVCPSGWHLPDNDEWNILFEAVGGSSIAGKALRSQNGWRITDEGTDAFGFTVLPAGNRDGLFGEFENVSFTSRFWSVTQYSDYIAYSAYFADGDYVLLTDFNSPKHESFSVRCIKD